MHAGKTLDHLLAMVAGKKFTIGEYCHFDSLISGLERDIHNWGKKAPMGVIRSKLHSARLYFQDACGFGTGSEESLERIKMFLREDLSILQEYLTDDKASFKKPKA